MRISILWAAIPLLYLAGCSTERTAAKNPTNSEIEQSVKARLALEPALAKISVNSDVDKNMVTLSGSVGNQRQKDEAATLAKAARSGMDVVNQVEVKPREITRKEYTEELAREARDKAKAMGEKVGDSLDDAWIHTKIWAKLATNSDTPARKINVDVVNNVVTLRGSVETNSARIEAGRLARETEGVKRVENLLKIRKEGTE